MANLKKDLYKNIGHSKPKELSRNASKVLKRLSEADKPTDEELVYYLNVIDDYNELGYIAHIICGQRTFLKKHGQDSNVWADTLQLIECKRSMLRDDKVLTEILSKYLEWYNPKKKPTCLTFGEAFNYNEEH